MRRLRILAAARDEAAAAAQWYESERTGLGPEFEAAIEAALDLLEMEPIPSLPYPGSAARLGVRRLVLRRFPYDVVFVSSAEFVTVIAFAHHSRRPGYWHNRLPV